jgi:hypothetical protein
MAHWIVKRVRKGREGNVVEYAVRAGQKTSFTHDERRATRFAEEDEAQGTVRGLEALQKGPGLAPIYMDVVEVDDEEDEDGPSGSRRP